jgi:ectoine hydroxylase-related dioxygenase (phytanoyl-CoA dioxygenase family)
VDEEERAVQVTTPPPAAPELRVANEYLGDHDALMQLLDQDGYLFFRGVLDVDAIATVRAAMVKVLQDHDLVEAGADLPRASTQRVGPGAGQTVAPVLDEHYNQLGLWQDFVTVPAVRSFFEQVAGGPVEFAPIAEYRSRPPGSTEIYWHQDGYYQQRFGLLTAWIPVMDLPTEMGGIAVASGQHHAGYLHGMETTSILPISEEVIDAAGIRRTDYHPGDVLVFGEHLPHTGLPNETTQNLYRLSIDVRFYREGRRGYLMGELLEVGDDWVKVRCDDGVTRRVEVPADILVRSKSGETLRGADLADWYMPIGDQVMVSTTDDRAVYLRPVKFKFGAPAAT